MFSLANGIQRYVPEDDYLGIIRFCTSSQERPSCAQNPCTQLPKHPRIPPRGGKARGARCPPAADALADAVRHAEDLDAVGPRSALAAGSAATPPWHG